MFITVSDLSSRIRSVADEGDLAILIEDAEARAVGFAPCLSGELTDAQQAQVRAIIRGAVERAADRTSADRQMTAGPFSIGPAPSDTSSSSKTLLWPSELDELSRVCSGRRGRARMGWLA